MGGVKQKQAREATSTVYFVHPNVRSFVMKLAPRSSLIYLCIKPALVLQACDLNADIEMLPDGINTEVR